MRIKKLEIVKGLIVPLIFGGSWYWYSQLFLGQNNQSMLKHFNNENTADFFNVALIGLVLMLIGAMYLGLKLGHTWLNKNSSLKITSQLAYDICRLYQDPDFLLYCKSLGLEIDNSVVKIKPEVMSQCSLGVLAKLVVYMFNKHELSRRHYEIIYFQSDQFFESLADVVIKSWPEVVGDDFIKLVYRESILLGQQLRYHVERQKITTEASSFNESVTARLKAIDEAHQTMMNSTIGQIDDHLNYRDYLLGGGSAIKTWVFKKIPNNILKKT